MIQWVLYLYFVVFIIVPSYSFQTKNSCPKLYQYPISSFSNKCYDNPDVLSDVPSMVVRHGFRFKGFAITTNDGYILNIFRVTAENKIPSKNFTVFLQHGIATSSAIWTDVGNRSLAFNLASQGYEVWLGNFRGTTFSNTHKTLNVNEPKFWDYNLDTLAAKDLSDQIHFVAAQTRKKIHYIGHSKGTTLIAMLLASNNTVAKSIQSVSLLAPVVYLTKVFGPLPPLGIELANILLALNIKGLFYQENLIHTALNVICKRLPHLCNILVDLIAGKSEQFPSDDLLLYFSYWPAGLSVYELKHYLQISQSQKFEKFDYGQKKNLEIYGTSTPPVYNLSKITVPICLFYGENDILYRQENVEKLFNELGSVNKCKYSIPEKATKGKKYAHIDFLYGESLREALYPILFDVIQKYEKL